MHNFCRCLVNAGLLILNETNIFWFSFPSAGIFMRKFIKGRQTLINIIKKRKFGEILQSVSMIKSYTIIKKNTIFHL